jgi:hypothetical protein
MEAPKNEREFYRRIISRAKTVRERAAASLRQSRPLRKGQVDDRSKPGARAKAAKVSAAGLIRSRDRTSPRLRLRSKYRLTGLATRASASQSQNHGPNDADAGYRA